MNQNHREDLSAGMDGELSIEEFRFLLRRIDHAPELQADWDRFHVARSGLRRELSVLASAGFAARVTAAIDLPQVPGSARPRRGHWLRLSAGGAIAASVAVAALMASRPSGVGGGEQIATRQAVSAAAPTMAQAQTQAPTDAPAPAVVPTWLSSNDPFRYSQRASFAPSGAASGEFVSPYAQPLSPYQVKGYRTLQNGDGSYLLLIDPTRQARGALPREAAVAQ